MINYESIKSLYNDKPTLLQWLKKVEEALSDATLTDVTPTEISPGVFTLTFTFDDGTTITTSNINIPQGVQGVSITGGTISSGNLVLTLSDGSTINAGNMGGVSSFTIDANQHLIVNYQNGTTQDLGAIFSGNINISGDLSVTGDAQIFENITDASGHNRFIEGNGTPSVATGYNVSYCKWSLSGTHLMVVVAGSFENGTEIGGFSFATFTLPQWVKDKIYPVWSTASIEIKAVSFKANDWSEQTANVVLNKNSDGLIITRTVSSSLTFTNKRYFRIQFDLLIDNN